jgi:mono/diheme cytochrome c family protein
MGSSQRTIWTVIISVIGLLIVEAIVVSAGVFSGLYDVAASRPHIASLEWMLGEAMDRSVEVHARGIKAPGEIPATEGAPHFDRMCVICHGAPGVAVSDIGHGLYPHPPDLVKSADDWTVEQIYWITKHGVRDTGMPAFGKMQGDRELWALAYMVKHLPGLGPEDYRALVSQNKQGASEK